MITPYFKSLSVHNAFLTLNTHPFVVHLSLPRAAFVEKAAHAALTFPLMCHTAATAHLLIHYQSSVNITPGCLEALRVYTMVIIPVSLIITLPVTFKYVWNIPEFSRLTAAKVCVTDVGALGSALEVATPSDLRLEAHYLSPSVGFVPTPVNGDRGSW